MWGENPQIEAKNLFSTWVENFRELGGKLISFRDDLCIENLIFYTHGLIISTLFAYLFL